jgi:hypothetical protein
MSSLLYRVPGAHALWVTIRNELRREVAGLDLWAAVGLSLSVLRGPDGKNVAPAAVRKTSAE